MDKCQKIKDKFEKKYIKVFIEKIIYINKILYYFSFISILFQKLKNNKLTLILNQYI